MKRTLFRAVVAIATVAALGLLVNAGTLRADDKDKDFGKGKPGETVPPQTLPQGFESHRDLAADASPSRHAGQISEFPGATLYVQKEELKQIDFFLAYPFQFNDGHIHAVNTLERHSYTSRQDIDGGTVFVPPTPPPPGSPRPNACARTPVCGYPPQTLHEIFDKLLAGEAKIIDGRHEIEDGLIIHPAFRGHTYGSQLLQVNTAIGQLVFGSDTYSSWEGIRDWQVANIQQTDTIQQFLAYEKCYALTSASPGSFNNCISAHEPTAYTSNYPITSNWWNIGTRATPTAIPTGNCSRAAELVLSNGESTHVPAVPDRVLCETRLTPGTFGYQK